MKKTMGIRELFEFWYRGKFGHRNANGALFFNHFNDKYVNKVTNDRFETFDAGIEAYIGRIKLGTVFIDSDENKYVVVHKGVDYIGICNSSQDYFEMQIFAKQGFQVELKDCKTGQITLMLISREY